MPNAETFWRYADEAMQCARESTTPEKRRALTDLAFTWSQVAIHSEDRGGEAPMAKTFTQERDRLSATRRDLPKSPFTI